MPGSGEAGASESDAYSESRPSVLQATIAKAGPPRRRDNPR